MLPNKLYVEKRKQSILTRILVAGTSSLIRNDWQGVGAQTRPISLGYDPIVKQQLGNGSFIVNSVNYLAGNTTLLQLRSTSQKLRLIDRAKLIYLSSWRWLNLLLPLLLLFLLAFAFQMLRRRTYV